MARSSVMLLCLACAALVAGIAMADTGADATHGAPVVVSAAKPIMAAATSSNGAAAPPAPAPAAKKGFSGMYFGILVSFVILWTIYFFLNFFETGSGGDYYFYLYSYLVLFILISSGLAKYFTASILTGLLVSFLFIIIASGAFSAMMGISPPNRFEGDKQNMGRTRLEGHM